MSNPLKRFKSYVTSSIGQWYSEMNLRRFLADGIRDGTVTIQKDETGRVYATIKIESEKNENR